MFTFEQFLIVATFIVICAWFSYRKGQKDMAEFAVVQTVDMLIKADHVRINDNEELEKIQEIVNAEILEYHNAPKKTA